MKTLIFDLDGTLLDTLIDLKNAVNHALNFRNLPNKDLEFVRKAIGNGTQVLIKRCTPNDISDEEIKAVFDCFKSYYLEHYSDNTVPYDGIKGMLIGLKNICRLVVVSNKDDDITKELINQQLPFVFDVIQGSYPNLPKKPNPYLINKIIKEKHIWRKKCLYIGDTEVDKETALNSGLDYVLVNYGYRSKEELEKTCPNDKSISSVRELVHYILKWVNSK